MQQEGSLQWAVVQIALLAVLVFAVLWRGVNTRSVSTVISMITVVFVVWFLKWKRMGELPERDERTKKLGAYAATYSWLVTLMLIALLFWVDYLAVVILTVTDAGTGHDVARDAALAEHLSLVLQPEGDVEWNRIGGR